MKTSVARTGPGVVSLTREIAALSFDDLANMVELMSYSHAGIRRAGRRYELAVTELVRRTMAREGLTERDARIVLFMSGITRSIEAAA